MTENLAIFLHYSFNGHRLKYFTGERIDLKNYIDDYFKKSREPIKKDARGAEKINDRLRALKLHLETIHTSAKALGIQPTADYFRTKLNELWKPNPEKRELTINEALDIFLELTRVNKAYNTYRNTKTAVNHLKDFFGNKKIQFTDLNNDLVDRLGKFIIDKGLLNNTVAKILRVFRTFLNWCIERKHMPKIDIKLGVKENEIDIIFLTYDEILHLYNKKFTTDHLERVKDVFIFGCFTGMRYGDIAKLKRTDIKDEFIRFYITKGKETLAQKVPLVSYTRAILAKYANYPGDKALPVISNQKMNDALKEICKEAEFNEIITIAEKQGNGKVRETQYHKWELITCHTSRKSFITVAMIMGMPENVVKSITGHSKNSKAFARYYDIIDSHKKSEMDKIFK